MHRRKREERIKQLIVNADDYGRTASVSAGIRRAHLRGIVTTTTAMMNMPSVEDDVRLALAECPVSGWACIGC